MSRCDRWDWNCCNFYLFWNYLAETHHTCLFFPSSFLLSVYDLPNLTHVLAQVLLVSPWMIFQHGEKRDASLFNEVVLAVHQVSPLSCFRGNFLCSLLLFLMCWGSLLHPHTYWAATRINPLLTWQNCLWLLYGKPQSVPTIAVMKEKDNPTPKKSHCFVSMAGHKKSLTFWYHEWELLSWISARASSGRTRHMCFAHISSNPFFAIPLYPQISHACLLV